MIPTSRLRTIAFSRAIFFCVILLGLSSLFAPRSFAGLFTLVDDNSTATFDTDSQANAFNWVVDGVDQLFQQAFWYRIGNVAEQSLDVLPHPVEGITDTNFDGNFDTLFVRYSGVGFRVDVRYALDGGTPGSRASDIAEQISIVNLGTSPLDFHFFQYSDFELNGTAANDSAVFTNANAVRQFEGVLSVSETVITPVPNHREIDFYPNTVIKLNDGVATTLNDTPIGVVVGPGDMTWAYQWDITLAAGGTFQISKDKQLSGVPEPATFSLLTAAAGLLFVLRRNPLGYAGTLDRSATGCRIARRPRLGIGSR